VENLLKKAWRGREKPTRHTSPRQYGQRGTSFFDIQILLSYFLKSHFYLIKYQRTCQLHLSMF